MSEEIDFSKLTVPELKEELSTKGLSTAGLKKDLIARLCEHAGEENPEGNGEEDEKLADDVHMDHTEDDEVVKMKKELQEQMNDEEEEGNEEKSGESQNKLPTSLKEVMFPVPPKGMAQFLRKSYLNGKKNTTIFLGEMNNMHVLSPTVVEWANRAMYFTVNYTRKGKGAAVLSYSCEAECTEAMEALRSALGEEVKVENAPPRIEGEMRRSLEFQPDGILVDDIGVKALVVEDCPTGTTVEHIVNLFPDALAVLPLQNTELCTKWDEREIKLPDTLETAFIVEFASSTQIPEEKNAEGEEITYSLSSQQVKVTLYDDFKDRYKEAYTAKMLKMKNDYLDVMDKIRKSDMPEFTLTDKDRMRKLQELEDLRMERSEVGLRENLFREERSVLKTMLTLRLFELLTEVDGDTDRRLRLDLVLPEKPEYMTKHTNEKYNDLSTEQQQRFKEENLKKFTQEKTIIKRGTTRLHIDRNAVYDRADRDTFRDDNSDHSVKCFNCGRMGHYANKCPDRGGDNRNSYRGEQREPLPGTRCYNCGTLGHYANKCPQKGMGPDAKRMRVDNPYFNNRQGMMGGGMGMGMGMMNNMGGGMGMNMGMGGMNMGNRMGMGMGGGMMNMGGGNNMGMVNQLAALTQALSNQVNQFGNKPQ